ncbi:alpha/beta hydrolase [Candidatus Uabimicrobium amorphum]|uniref:Lipase/esterase n=1 Tax=Uabimicrobium amorphum TaxID=2596890 RepID=A0A5S9IK90_UABAM|nr:alpha/beta hydrolase [Candidatus Uabimicrobium amorphum]BBM83080.1 lipase/esterase [Candidatus Uabimicrobium amorphum]
MRYRVLIFALIFLSYATAEKYPATFTNVSYGPDERNVMDVWVIDSPTPTPVLIYMHGGGFVTGDKKYAQTDPILRQCMEKKIAVVSINYRFVTTHPYPAPMLDGKRALQFVRHNAKKWNINKEKVALLGYSAGALMGLWLGLKNDMADPMNEDPVLRESTRVQIVVPKQAPTSTDPIWILQNIGGDERVYPSLLDFYGIESFDEIYKPEIRKIAYDSSPINFVSNDDPPVVMYYHGDLTTTPLAKDTPMNTSIHHPQFGVLLKKKMDALGLLSYVHYRSAGSKKTIISFLNEVFYKN